MLRRLVLVGFATVLLPGTVLQLVVGFLYSFVHLVVRARVEHVTPPDRRARLPTIERFFVVQVQVQAQPYQLVSDDALAAAASASLVVIFVICIILYASRI